MNIYKEKFKLGAYYTYDKNNKKVYDIKTMREDFKVLVKNLKKR
jgi:cell fate regulator YaaT (PSP1 superfamily)